MKKFRAAVRAYTLLTLFRSVTQRSEDKRAMRWQDLLRAVYNTAIALNEEALKGLRTRTISVCG